MGRMTRVFCQCSSCKFGPSHYGSCHCSLPCVHAGTCHTRRAIVTAHDEVQPLLPFAFLLDHISLSNAGAPHRLSTTHTHCNTMVSATHQSHVVGYQCAGLKGVVTPAFCALPSAIQSHIWHLLMFLSAQQQLQGVRIPAYCMGFDPPSSRSHGQSIAFWMPQALCRTLHVRHISLLLID